MWSDRKYQQLRSSWKGRSWCSPWARTTCPSRSSRSTLLVGYQQQGAVADRLEQRRVLDAAWARTWRCRGALPWVPAPSSGGRITRTRVGSRSLADGVCAREDQTRILSGHAAQPRDHGVRVQSSGRVFQPGARIQRATVGLQTQPRGIALDPAVLEGVLAGFRPRAPRGGSCGVSSPHAEILLFRQKDPKPLAPVRGPSERAFAPVPQFRDAELASLGQSSPPYRISGPGRSPARRRHEVAPEARRCSFFPRPLGEGRVRAILTASPSVVGRISVA